MQLSRFCDGRHDRQMGPATGPAPVACSIRSPLFRLLLLRLRALPHPSLPISAMCPGCDPLPHRVGWGIQAQPAETGFLYEIEQLPRMIQLRGLCANEPCSPAQRQQRALSKVDRWRRRQYAIKADLAPWQRVDGCRERCLFYQKYLTIKMNQRHEGWLNSRCTAPGYPLLPCPALPGAVRPEGMTHLHGRW